MYANTHTFMTSFTREMHHFFYHLCPLSCGYLVLVHVDAGVHVNGGQALAHKRVSSTRFRRSDVVVAVVVDHEGAERSG